MLNMYVKFSNQFKYFIQWNRVLQLVRLATSNMRSSTSRALIRGNGILGYRRWFEIKFRKSARHTDTLRKRNSQGL